MHYWLWTFREAWSIKGRRKHFFLHFQTNLQSYTTNLSNNSSIHKFQICHPNTDSMQYWPLSIRGSHSLPRQGLHKLLWIKPRQVCISVHLPVLSFCSLSPHARVLHQLSLHCHTPPSSSKECASSSPARLFLIQIFSNNIFVGPNTTSIQYTVSLLYLSYHWANSKLSWPQCLSLSFLFFFFFFDVDLFKVLNLLQYCFCCVCVLVLWPWGVWDLSSRTRDRTHAPCTGRQSLNHWTSREVSSVSLFLDLLWFALDSWIVCKVSKNCPLANLIASSLYWCFTLSSTHSCKQTLCTCLFLFFKFECEPIFKTETDSQTQKTNLWLPNGKGEEKDTLGAWD